MENKVNSYSDIKRIIWDILELLRKNNSNENLNIIAFILFLKKENVIDKISWRFENDSLLTVNEAIEMVILDFYSRIASEIPNKLMNIFSKELRLLDKFTLIKICESLNEIDNSIYQVYAAKIIDDVYLKISQRTGKRSEAFIQPKEITKLITTIANLPSGAHIYNPFAGLASYGVGFNIDYHYYGQELNHNIWALGIIRLLAHDMKTDNYIWENSIANWEESYPIFDPFKIKKIPNSKFDLVVSTPPFGMRMDAFAQQTIFKNAPTVEEFVLINGMKSLKQNGKMILVVSRGVLSNGNKISHDIRKNLIDNNLLELVISIPSGIFDFSNISTSILVFNKNKKHINEVKFVNGDTFVVKKNNHKVLSTRELLKNILSETETDFAKTCTNDDIIKNDYNLNPNIYFAKEVETPAGYNLFELKHLLLPLTKNTNYCDLFGRYIQIGDLSNNPVDFEKTFSEKEVSQLKKNAIKLDKSALLISRISSNLKPTYIKSNTNEPIFISPNIWTFEVNTSLVEISFLINELYSKYVQDQLNVFSMGSTIASLSLNNFLGIKLLIPTLENQKEIVNEARKKIILEKETELKSLKIRFEQQTYEEFASLKHALGKPIPGISTALEYIYDYLQKNEGNTISLNDIVSKRRQTTLQDKFDVINNGFKLIQTLLQKGDNGFVLENYPLESCKIARYIKEYLDSYNSDKYTIYVSDYYNNCDDIEIMANEDLITILLNDVMSNINNHAFEDIDLENNRVDVFLAILNNRLELIIANNGKPFPKNFDQSKFTQKYQKAGCNSGSGIGGYDINRITQYFNGAFKLITDPILVQNYIVYQFTFPILDIKEELYE